MRLWFILGTAAELIKVFPVLHGAMERGLECQIWSTGQSDENFWMQFDDFKLPREQAFCLDAGATDLKTSWQAARWMFRNCLRSSRQLRRQIESKMGISPLPDDLCIVHGDTFSTVLGAIFAKRLGCRLAHIEAGMRSGDIFNPFPEELNRRYVSRKADLHFAPDQNALGHLMKENRRGKFFVTDGNSVADAMTATLQVADTHGLPSNEHVVANLHRFENLKSDARWTTMIDTLIKAQHKLPVYFVMHPPTRERLDRDPAAKKRLLDAGVHLQDRLSYSQFIHLMATARFVLTDGGSNQTECAYLGLPCLIMREKTELPEGLDKNCILSRFDVGTVDRFLADWEQYRHPPQYFARRPSDTILDAIEGRTVK